MNRTEQTMLRAAMDFCCADADVQCAKNHCMGVRGDLRGCSVLVVPGVVLSGLRSTAGARASAR